MTEFHRVLDYGSAASKCIDAIFANIRQWEPAGKRLGAA
jgi:hypothetical protein